MDGGAGSKGENVETRRVSIYAVAVNESCVFILTSYLERQWELGDALKGNAPFGEAWRS